MGKHILGSLMSLMLLLTCAMAGQGISKHGPTQKHFWKGHELPREPEKGYYKHLEECMEVLSERCGGEMFGYIFYKRVEMSYVCCHQLVKMGMKCNKDLSHTLANIKDFESLKEQIYSRAKRMYHHCARINRCVADDQNA